MTHKHFPSQLFQDFERTFNPINLNYTEYCSVDLKYLCLVKNESLFLNIFVYTTEIYF